MYNIKKSKKLSEVLIQLFLDYKEDIMTLMIAFVLVIAALAIGDVISASTKAFVPSVFVTSVIFAVCYWTGVFPKDIVALAGFQKPIIYLALYLLITHMGTMLSVKELAAQWKTVVIALTGVAGMIAFTMTIGSSIFGFESAVIATPPLTGGVVAAILMNQAALDLGLDAIAVLAIVTFTMQGFVGYPITALLIRKEGGRVLGEYKKGNIKLVEQSDDVVSEKKKLIPKTPKRFQTNYIILAKLGIVAMLADQFASLVNPFIKSAIGFDISAFVFCLIFGVVAQEIGFIEPKPLDRASSFGFTIVILMMLVFDGLSSTTPEMIANVAVPLVGIIVIGVAGLALFSILIGKFLGYSLAMSFAVAITALIGFPPNYIITDESTTALAENDEEKAILMQEMMPKMLVGGFTTVTIVSVIVAGIFVGFLK